MAICTNKVRVRVVGYRLITYIYCTNAMRDIIYDV